MNLTSLTNQGNVFWRVFDPSEPVYAVGLAEGVLAPGQTATFNHPSGFFQMEIKRGEGVFAPTLIPAGRVFRNDEQLVLSFDGQLETLSSQLQANWRWCRKCSGMFFANGQPEAGVCPEGGFHDATASGSYTLAHNTRIPSGQPDWRWCSKCQGLFHASGQNDTGVCPAGGQHVKGTSGDYALTQDDARVAGQSKWRWCHKCSGLFFAGTQVTTGRCPSGVREEHDSRPSGDYTVMHVPNP
jgi:hypothetical protein